jgi:DNA-directed RNA polymerase subunit M/transcription elongation factor TFIIS
MILHKPYKFCPECESVMIRREHRGWIQKHILRQTRKYRCGNCQAVFFIPLFEKDLKKLKKENDTICYEEKPIISIEDIREISFITESEDEASTLSLNDLEDEFKRGYQKGYQKGYQRGLDD